MSSAPRASSATVSMPAPSAASRRAYWLKTLHQWHWISSALSLVGMLLFSITGITLNHAGQIESRPAVTTLEAALPAALAEALRAPDTPQGDKDAAPLPPALRQWLGDTLDVRVSAEHEAEWSGEEIYVSLPRPGGDAWVRIDREGGQVEYERTDRGWIAYLNDLHKGRHTGTAWRWFIDIFAAATLVFAVTGLFIIKLHAANRPSTWPVIGAGLVLPLLLALLFIH